MKIVMACTLLLILIINCSCGAQELLYNVEFFETSKHFRENKSIEHDSKMLVYDRGPNYIKLSKVFEISTNDRMKKLEKSWAIKYENEYYFNLLYSNDLNKSKLFVRIDSIGQNYCYSFIYKDGPKVISRANSRVTNQINMGALGVLLTTSFTKAFRWKNAWSDKQGRKVNILLIDLTREAKKTRQRKKSSLGSLVTKPLLQRKFLNEIRAKRNRNFKVEDIVEIIESKNH